MSHALWKLISWLCENPSTDYINNEVTPSPTTQYCGFNTDPQSGTNKIRKSFQAFLHILNINTWRLTLDKTVKITWWIQIIGTAVGYVTIKVKLVKVWPSHFDGLWFGIFDSVNTTLTDLVKVWLTLTQIEIIPISSQTSFLSSSRS